MMQANMESTQRIFAGDDAIAERPATATRCARLAAFLRSRPGVWLDGHELATVGGAYGWRTRISDLRRPPYNMNVENRLRRERGFVVSEYRLVVEDGEA
jgi:hypothetical protein